MIRIPSEKDFRGDYLPAPELGDLSVQLCKKHPDREFILDWQLHVLWKSRGGTPKGKARLGVCSKPAGLTKFYSEADWIIWVAADHAREMGFGDRELEAVVFHELQHCALTEPDDDEEQFPTIVGHDFEVFIAEIEEYGLWRPTLQVAGEVFARQLELFKGPADEKAEPS